MPLCGRYTPFGCGLLVLQIEIHPFLLRPALARECTARGIVVQAYCPLLRAKRMADPRLLAVAAAVGKSPAQVLLRWSLQKGAFTIHCHHTLCYKREQDRLHSFTVAQ